MSYDAWGRRRNPVDWNYTGLPDPSTYLINRGYTFHEHYDKLGLINMNGRVYDPVVGRFLSVDPLVSDPLSAQSYNGYSYCLNNPLKYTDPSGYTYLSVMLERGGVFAYRGSYINGGEGTRGGGSASYYAGGSSYGLPSSGGNGSGAGGYYYDWSSGTYRSTSSLNEVSFGTAYNNLVQNYLRRSKDTKDGGYAGNPLYPKSRLGGGPGAKFKSLDGAAMDFGQRYNDNSIRMNLELGTVFYAFEDNGEEFYSYIVPIVGEEAGVTIPLSAPYGTDFVGVGHTHGFGDNVGYESFSKEDKATLSFNYLCTPNGALYRYDARDHSTVVIARDLPNMSNYNNYYSGEANQGHWDAWDHLVYVLFK